MRIPDETSPLNLIQESYKGDVWKICVISIILSISNSSRSRPIIEQFFVRFPDPSSAVKAKQYELEALLLPTGLHRKKAERIQILSRRISNGGWESVDDLPYMGQHGRENFQIFVKGELIDEPSDKELKKFIEWAKSWHSSRT